MTVEEQLVERVTRLEVQMNYVREDSSECRKSVAALKSGLEDRAEMRTQERKQDRRWMVGTILGAAGLVIAAMAIIVPLVS